jgi:hypothetical protein
MPFSDINKAFQLLEEGKSLRCLLNFWFRTAVYSSVTIIRVAGKRFPVSTCRIPMRNMYVL